MPVKKAIRSSRQPRSLARQRKRPASANLADSDTLRLAAESRARGVRRQPPSATRVTKLSVPIYSLSGRASGTLSLPKEIFGQKVNKKLLAQAMRVYLINQKSLFASTKTRGEVEGSTAKIQRQKGTGRARHGSVRAPIFVGGGVTFGPKPRKVRLDLPKRMKKAALLSALSSKLVDKNVIGLTGAEKASGKTKEIAKLMSSVVSRQSSDKKQANMSALIVTPEKIDNVVRAVRNIQGISILPANLINAYEVLKHELLLVTKEAVNVILGSETTPESGKRDSGRAPLARTTTKKGAKK